MKNKQPPKINYYNTPNEKRRSGDLYVNLMSSLMMKKVIKKIRKDDFKKRKI